MAYVNLAEFLKGLEDVNDVVRISAEVDNDLELAAIVEHFSKQHDAPPALFFDNVKSHSIPIFANILGTKQRMLNALATESFDELGERLMALIRPDIPQSWIDSLQLVPRITELLKLPPKVVKTAICQQVVKIGQDVDLNEIPFPRCWPNETNPSIANAQIVICRPNGGAVDAPHIVGQVPLQIIGKDRVAVHWTTRDEELGILEQCRKSQRQVPVAIVLGGDPLLAYAASVPLPPNTDGWTFAGFLRQANVDVILCRTIEALVPADAEIVIEGMLNPEADKVEVDGLGLSTGFYGPKEIVPAIQVTAITQRSNPMLPVQIPSAPPNERSVWQRATERMTLPLAKLTIPELVDIHCPESGAFRNSVFASIQKTYAGQARKVMNALWGFSWLSTMKQIVIVDEDVNVQDESAVQFQIGANMHPGRDIVFCEGPTDMNDHAAPVRGMGHKMGIDATRKLAEEGHPRDWPEPLDIPANLADKIELLLQ